MLYYFFHRLVIHGISFKYIYRTGLEGTIGENQLIFHSGTDRNAAGRYITNGGRVLINVALSADLRTAAAEATKGCEKIKFEGAQFRTDIAQKAFRQ